MNEDQTPEVEPEIAEVEPKVAKDEQKPTEEDKLSQAVRGIIEKNITEIAEAVHDVGMTRGRGIAVAKEHLQQQLDVIHREHEIKFGYYASWMLPESKDIRKTFVTYNIQKAFDEALLLLLCKLFGFQNAGDSFVTFFKQALEKQIEHYKNETKMMVTKNGLRHVN